MRYYSTFPPGLEDVAGEALSDALRNVQVVETLQGALVYETDRPLGRIASLRFFQNSFFVLKTFHGLRGDRMAEMMRAFAAARLDRRLFSALEIRDAGTFRVVTSVDNRLVSPDRKLLSAVETKLEKLLNARTARAGAEGEVWFLHRREGNGYAMARLSRRRGTERTLNKGEVAPETANLLCSLSRPADDDVFLDPFCGYGGIVAERAAAFPAAAVGGCDIDPRMVEHTRRKVSGAPNRCAGAITVETDDARRLGGVRDGSASKVVTDPPWGRHAAAPADIAALYDEFLGALHRVLSPKGIAVLLVERDGPMDGLIASRTRVFETLSVHRILLSGRKATVHTVRRKK